MSEKYHIRTIEEYGYCHKNGDCPDGDGHYMRLGWIVAHLNCMIKSHPDQAIRNAAYVAATLIYGSANNEGILFHYLAYAQDLINTHYQP